MPAALPPPRVLSRTLRLGTGPDLARRRWIFGLSLLGTLMAQLVGLFQVGLVRSLPDPPAGPFASSRVSPPRASTPRTTPTGGWACRTRR